MCLPARTQPRPVLLRPNLHKHDKKNTHQQETGAAFAKDGEFGSLLEGRFVALAHPAVMGALFLYTGYAGWLGCQWRRTRTIGDDIKALKATVPKAAAAAAAEGAPAAPPSPAEQQIAALEAVSWFSQKLTQPKGAAR